MALQQIEVPATLTTVNCGVCGGVYAINERYRALCEERGESWHCPYCQTGWGYFGRGETDRLRKKLEEQIREATRANDRAIKAERSLKRVKTEMKKTKDRIHAGVCPCCERTFQQLARHMKAKHPDYKGEAS